MEPMGDLQEVEWWTCDDPGAMLLLLRGKATERQLRLFAVGCARLVWDELEEPGLRQLVEIAEQRADGLVSEEQVLEFVNQPGSLAPGVKYCPGPSGYDISIDRRVYCILSILGAVSSREKLSAFPERMKWWHGQAITGSREPDLVRDIFGPLPFRSVALDPAWLTPAVVDLARRIYTERAFDRLPALADALVAAGCQDAEILAHCRSQGPHVKGCWVLDLLMGWIPGRSDPTRDAGSGITTPGVNTILPSIPESQPEPLREPLRETDWWSCGDPEAMLWFLQGKASERKLRLFAVACARLVFDDMADPVMRQAVELAEQRADGLASGEEQLEFVSKLTELPVEYRSRTGDNWFQSQTEGTVSAYFLARTAVAHWYSLAKLPDRLSWREGSKTTGSSQPDLLRDIFGPLPFRPVVLEPAWLAPAVVELAQHIYLEKAFAQLPALATVLAVAGCQDTEILAHCRSAGPHVKGCWVIDLLLGKE